MNTHAQTCAKAVLCTANGSSNCTVKARFQLAIIAHWINLTGYDITTAQSSSEMALKATFCIKYIGIISCVTRQWMLEKHCSGHAINIAHFVQMTEGTKPTDTSPQLPSGMPLFVQGVC